MPPSRGRHYGCPLPKLLAVGLLQTVRAASVAWVFGDGGASCTEACAKCGGKCVEDETDWPTSAHDLELISGGLAVECNKEMVIGGNPYDPSRVSNGFCQWDSGAGLRSLARHCSAKPPRDVVSRFCPCEPVSGEQAALGACTSWQPPWDENEKYLRLVDAYFDRQPRQANGLLRTYGPSSLGGGPCGDRCRLAEPCPSPKGCRYDTYDNSLAALYYTKRGQLDKAQAILDIFSSLLYPNTTMGLPRELYYDDIPSGKVLTLLATAFSDKGPTALPGIYSGDAVFDGSVDTGNNAWAALAFAHYAAATGVACYATAARDILHVLTSKTGCKDDLGGFKSRLPPNPQHYRSTEHNIDMVALARMLGDSKAEASARKFVNSMYGRNKDFKTAYSLGTGDGMHCDGSQPPDVPVPADGVFWNALADADPILGHTRGALRFATATPASGATGQAAQQGLWEENTDLIYPDPLPALRGTRFTTAGHGVQWENTAGAAMAMLHFQWASGDEWASLHLADFVTSARKSLQQILRMYGAVPGSVLGGGVAAWVDRGTNTADTKYPGGSDTALGWTYLRYLHVASTAWTGLLLLYSPEGGDNFDDVQEDANPFAPPARPMPTDIEVACPKATTAKATTSTLTDTATTARTTTLARTTTTTTALFRTTSAIASTAVLPVATTRTNTSTTTIVAEAPISSRAATTTAVASTGTVVQPVGLPTTTGEEEEPSGGEELGTTTTRSITPFLGTHFSVVIPSTPPLHSTTEAAEEEGSGGFFGFFRRSWGAVAQGFSTLKGRIMHSEGYRAQGCAVSALMTAASVAALF